jgi:hypothetical protein
MKLETSRARDVVTPPYSPRCEQCNGLITLPQWSERLNARCTRYLWSCAACGYQFESWTYAAKTESQQAP